MAFLIAILVNSRISAVAAAVGSPIGIGIGWALGLPVTVHVEPNGVYAIPHALAVSGVDAIEES